MEKIVAIIPAFNEEVALGSVILLTSKYVDRIIVIDDGSIDRTGEIAELADVKLIKHHKNLGKGEALKNGFSEVAEGEIVVTIDADGQHNPEDIPRLVKPIINGEADIVNGSRYLHGTDKNTPKYRRVGQKILDKATNFASGLDLTDSQSGFRAFSYRSISSFKFSEAGFGVESQMLADASEDSLKILEVEIEVKYDVGESTKNPISHGFKVLFDIIREIQFRRPLYYFTLPGLVLAFIGILFSLIFLNDYMSGRSINFGPTALSIMLSFVGGFLILTGMILDSIKKLIKNI